MVWTEGEQVGAYILGKELGQGGMATVYMAHHPRLNRDVAVKVMHKNFLDDEGFVARFKREAQIVAQLSHPHIIPVYDFDEHEGQPYLVMKYVRGFTLKKQVIKNPPTLEGVVEIMSAIGDALTYAHGQGILHRDIKPSNIVIDGEGIPYLTDFGLARLAASGESTMSADMLLGTPHYISPEQARGKSLDGRTDIYSLGVVLYELMVGRVPFTGDTAFSIIHDHIYTPLPAPTEANPELPKSVEDVLYKALAKHPDDRYDTANELIEDLRHAITAGDLQGLNPDRATVAAMTLAKIREGYDDDLTITPAIGSPYGGGSSVRAATLRPKPTPFYDQGRFWIIGGVAALLIIVFMAFGVLLTMAGTLQELNLLTINDVVGEDVVEAMPAPDNLAVIDYETLGIEVSDEFDFPLVSVPYVALEDLPARSGDPVLGLLRARSLYETGDIEEARSELVTDIPSAAEEAVYYLVNATELAESMRDTQASVFFALLGATFADENGLFTEDIRAFTVENIYAYADDIDVGNLRETLGTIIVANPIDPETLNGIVNSPVASFLSTRSLILNDNYRLAQGSLLAEDSAINPIDAEFLLLRAEIQLGLGNQTNALRILNGILERDDIPEWVIIRAGELITEFE